MLETIQHQFKSGKTLTQSKHYNIINRGHWPKFYWDLYPLAQEYYHELNPYFLFNIYRPELFKFSKVFTVRDGYLNFATFMLEHLMTFSKLEAGIMLIHPDLAPIVPPSLAHNFACWNIVQKKQISIAEAKKVIIFGFISEQYLGELDNLPQHLKDLKNIPEGASVEIFLPIRKNVFQKVDKESVAIHHVMSHIKDALPGRNLKILTGHHFFEITDFKNTFVFDLMLDKFIVSDSYLHYYVQSRGATVNNKSLTKAPKNSLFNFDISLHHELHITPLPTDHNIFTELLFYKKQNPTVKDLLYDGFFQSTLRDLLKK